MLEKAQDAFSTIYVCKLFHEYGKKDALCTGCTVDADFVWTVILEGLCNICGFVCPGEFNDYTWLTKYYFSDPAMMEYYRLCRKYSRLYGVRLKENPFMLKADEVVDNMLNHISAGQCGWKLHTRINHRWASGIVFLHTEHFEVRSHLELIEALLEIFGFYEMELVVLKGAVVGRENTVVREAA